MESRPGPREDHARNLLIVGIEGLGIELLLGAVIDRRRRRRNIDTREWWASDERRAVDASARTEKSAFAAAGGVARRAGEPAVETQPGRMEQHLAATGGVRLRAAERDVLDDLRPRICSERR